MKIIITGDLLRPVYKTITNQNMNIIWLYNLLNWQVRQAIRDAEISYITSGHDKKSFDPVKFFSFYGLDHNVESWAKLFDTNQINDDALEYFSSFFDNSLVIGFELPNNFISFFNKLSIPFIDLSIHPARFLDDIFFAIKTNNEDVYKRITSYAISEDIFYLQANIHKATLSRFPQANIEENSSLLVGQTNVDRSLLCDGKVLGLLDYLQNIEDISDKRNKIYFKPHPYMLHDKNLMSALQKLNYIEIVNENVYKLLSHRNIVDVYSISSSVVYESLYFGKEGTYFYKSLFDFYDSINQSFNSNRSVSIYESYFNPSFWSDILSGVCSVNDCRSVMPPSKTSRLRTSLNVFWGYNFLDFEIQYNDVRHFYPNNNPCNHSPFWESLKKKIAKIPMAKGLVRKIKKLFRS